MSDTRCNIHRGTTNKFGMSQGAIHSGSKQGRGSKQGENASHVFEEFCLSSLWKKARMEFCRHLESIDGSISRSPILSVRLNMKLSKHTSSRFS